MPERAVRLAGMVPMRRAADPDEVARAIAWAASDEASYLTATATVATVGGGLQGSDVPRPDGPALLHPIGLLCACQALTRPDRGLVRPSQRIVPAGTFSCWSESDAAVKRAGASGAWFQGWLSLPAATAAAAWRFMARG
jgi:hypothetical protein